MQGLLPVDSASHRNITVTSLLEPWSKSTFHFLQQQIFQWFWLLWERPKVDVSRLSCLLIISLVCLALTLLMWRIWWAPNNSNLWQMGFNSAFKGLMQAVKVVTVMQDQHVFQCVHQLLIKYLCDLVCVFIICIDTINHPPAWINCISFLGPYDSHWGSSCKWWQSFTRDLKIAQWMWVMLPDSC